jgi:hypothetical protein
MPYTNENPHSFDADQNVYALRHLETREYICLRHDKREYLAAFSDGDTAFQFREELGMVEHVDIITMRLSEAPFDQFWLDGKMMDAHGVPAGDMPSGDTEPRVARAA